MPARVLGDTVGNAVLYTDGELQGDDFSLETAELIRQYGPWGQGFPEPVFDGYFEIGEL